MTYEEFLQWLTGYLTAERKKENPDSPDNEQPVFKNPDTGAACKTTNEAAQVLNHYGKLAVIYPGEPDKTAVLDKNTLDKRMKMIGVYEGDQKYANDGDCKYKKNYKGVKKFTTEEKGKILFNPEYDNAHEKARIIKDKKNRRNKVCEQFPQSHDITSGLLNRAYKIYLDISETPQANQNNTRLQEMMKTETGRKAFLGTIINDVTNADYQDLFKERTIDESLDYYLANQKKLDMLFIMPLLVQAVKHEEYKVDKSVSDMLTSFDLIAQSSAFYDSYYDAFIRDDYYMLSALNNESVAPMLSGTNPDVISAAAGPFVTYYNCINDKLIESGPINTLAQMGALSPFVRLSDVDKKPLSVQQAVDAIKAEKKVVSTSLSDAERKALQEQINNPYKLDKGEIDKINDKADKIYKMKTSYDAYQQHMQTLDELGAVGQLRKELEFNQLMLGQTDRVKDASQFENRMAKIFAISSLIKKVEKINREYADASKEELDDIIETITDPEQINANAEMIAKSDTFRSFINDTSAENIERLAIKQQDAGKDNPELYSEILGISERLEHGIAGELEKLHAARESLNAYLKNGGELGKNDDVRATLDAADEYCKKLSEKDKLSDIDIKNLKSIAQLHVMYDNPKDTKKEIKAVSVKLICEQGAKLLTSDNYIKIPAKGNNPERIMKEKDFGMALLTNVDFRNEYCENQMKKAAFEKTFGNKDEQTLKQIMKVDDRVLFDAFAGVVSSFRNERKNQSAAQNKPVEKKNPKALV